MYPYAGITTFGYLIWEIRQSREYEGRNRKKYIPARGAVNNPAVKFMASPSFTRNNSYKIGLIWVNFVEKEEFLWTYKWTALI